MASYSSDICIYGATSGGIMAAVRASKMGKKVSLISQDNYYGGTTSGGLSAVDLPYDGADDNKTKYIRGDVLDFFKRVNNYYYKNSPQSLVYYRFNKDNKLDYYPLKPQLNRGLYLFEPHVAKNVFNDLLNEQTSNITIYYNQKITGTTMNGTKIQSITMLNGNTFSGKMFIDCSYEGDLLKYSGVPYIIGREAKSKYNEYYAGIINVSSLNIDAYKTVGDKTSGLIMSNINTYTNYKAGDASSALQTFNYRLCLTSNVANMIPFTAPPNYNPNDYEILFRLNKVNNLKITDIKLTTYNFKIPNNKRDYNLDPYLAGNNINYLEDNDGIINYAKREQFLKDTKNWTQGFLYTLATDLNISENFRNTFSKLGLAADEFTDNEGWPTALYVREGRRMISDYVMNESQYKQADNKYYITNSNVGNVISKFLYGIDSHVCQYILNKNDTKLYSEGNINSTHVLSYIPYEAIIPPRDKCTNLLVPWSLSASHIIFCALRLEPAFMQIAQSAATAAALCINNNINVQDLKYSQLSPLLYSLSSLTTNPSPARAPQPNPAPATLIPSPQFTISAIDIVKKTLQLIPLATNPSTLKEYYTSFTLNGKYIPESIHHFINNYTVNIPNIVQLSDINKGLVDIYIHGTFDLSPTAKSIYSSKPQIINLKTVLSKGGDKKKTRKIYKKKTKKNNKKYRV